MLQKQIGTSSKLLNSQLVELYDLEERILQFSGLEKNREIFIYDIQIQLKDKVYQIHTYQCGNPNQESLVMLHGFGGSSVLYYPMLNQLSKKFKVYCLDFIDMGLSSREKFECKSTEETLDFLADSIEEWRKAVGLETFHLVGHSFGGYISGQYALRYQKHVKKLTLLSPVGLTKHMNEPTIEEARQKLGFLKGFMFGFFMKMWDNRVTPTKFMVEHPWITKWIVRKVVNKRFRLKGLEAELMEKFIMKMLCLPLGAEEAIHFLMKPPFGHAHYPLEEVIVRELEIPVDCFFGERDYMDTTGAKRIQEEKRKKNFVLKMLPNAEHQLTMQNPKVLAEKIIEAAEYVEEVRYSY